MVVGRCALHRLELLLLKFISTIFFWQTYFIPWILSLISVEKCSEACAALTFQSHILRYQPPFRTVRARITVALVVFIKTPINHIFFKSLIIPDYGFELTKTIYLNVFRNWNVLCKSTLLYKSCSTPAGNKRKKTIITPHSLLNTFHSKTVSRIFDKCVCVSFISKWSWER